MQYHVCLGQVYIRTVIVKKIMNRIQKSINKRTNIVYTCIIRSFDSNINIMSKNYIRCSMKILLEETITFTDNIKTHCIIIETFLQKFFISFHIACTFYSLNECVFNSTRGFLFFCFSVSANKNVVLIQEKHAYLIALIRLCAINQKLLRAFCR